LDLVTIANDSPTAGGGEGLGGDDLPVVICVVVRGSGDLLAWVGMLDRPLSNYIDWLTLATNPPVVVSQGVVLRVGVEENLGVAMLHGDGIVVPDLCLGCE
jgi:hypothetical protein